MNIAGEYENIPSWVADWPHCYDFGGDICNDLRFSVVSRSLKIAEKRPISSQRMAGSILLSLTVPEKDSRKIHK